MTKNMNICVSQTDILQNATSVVGKIKKIKAQEKIKDGY
ncbi:hypothetical protein NBRC111893_106 [Lentilactobacillus kosonis]|uniref:Uncharacterized protein n=1 Tax=Lentilactobacillus kosonis TaxID=2810561 RepID=A0A401FHV6_9LACO|nr:hypothetical protein NBRC111893_106 [Lentilactobacillus kosonis]